MIFIALALIGGIVLLVLLIRNLLMTKGQKAQDRLEKVQKILKMVLSVETGAYIAVFAVVMVKTILA